MSNHVSKIDMRHLDGGGGCPFVYMSSVNCAMFLPGPEVQYICECGSNEPRPKVRGVKNE